MDRETVLSSVACVCYRDNAARGLCSRGPLVEANVACVCGAGDLGQGGPAPHSAAGVCDRTRQRNNSFSYLFEKQLKSQCVTFHPAPGLK